MKNVNNIKLQTFYFKNALKNWKIIPVGVKVFKLVDDHHIMLL